MGTVLGPVTIRRAWYHCPDCGHGLAPRDEQLGVAGQGMTPGLRKMTARAAASVPFAQASTLLHELAGVQVTAKRAGRRAEADGAAAAARIQAEAEAIAASRLAVLPPSGPLPDKLYAAIDGTGVPMTPAGTDGRPGKGEDGRARTREVKMAAMFTQTALDGDGYPVRDPGSSSYLATLAAAPEFGILMAAEARRRGAGHVRQLTILGDGAPWIWNLAARHFPGATQVVDLFHAREHVHDLASLAARLLAGHHDEWLAGRLAELDAGDIPALLAAGRDLKFRRVAGPRTRQGPALLPGQRHPHALRLVPDTWACSSAPASSKPAANPSSASGSSSPGCAGPSTAPPASSPSDARTAATAGTRPGSPPDPTQPDPAI